jgi:Flp pilus assembly secretin CpaC
MTKFHTLILSLFVAIPFTNAAEMLRLSIKIEEKQTPIKKESVVVESGKIAELRGKTYSYELTPTHLPDGKVKTELKIFAWKNGNAELIAMPTAIAETGQDASVTIGNFVTISINSTLAQ